jgi:hypothetical protein
MHGEIVERRYVVILGFDLAALRSVLDGELLFLL